MEKNGLISRYDNESVSLENGITVGYHDEGDSPATMVLLHGLNAHSGSWRRNVRYFSQRMKVVAPSMPPIFTIREALPVHRYVEILEELLSKLGSDSIHLVGHSMGGWVAMRYSLLHQTSVKTLVLEDTAGVGLSKEDPIELGSQELGKIVARTLIIWGELDPIIPVETARVLKSEIRASKLVVVQGAGHSPHWERPTEFNSSVRSFLRLPE